MIEAPLYPPEEERGIPRNQNGHVCKAHRLLYHSILGLRVIKKKKNGYLRFRAKWGQLTRFYGLLRERQGQNLAFTVLSVPYWLDSGCRKTLLSLVNYYTEGPYQ